MTETGISEHQAANLRAAREAFETYISGDVEGVLAHTHPEVEVYLPSDLPNSGTFHGHDGYRTWISNWLEAWENFKIEVLGMEPVGDRHVVTAVRQAGTGRGSGIQVEMDVAYLSEIRDGKFVALQLYLSEAEARRVAEDRERKVAD